MLELLPNLRLIGGRRDLMLEQGTDRIEAFLLRLPRGSRRHVLRGWRERYLDFGQVERFWERERRKGKRENGGMLQR